MTRSLSLRGVGMTDSSVTPSCFQYCHVPPRSDETISALAQLASDPVLGQPGPPDHLATVEDCLALCDLGTVLLSCTCAYDDVPVVVGITSPDTRGRARGSQGSIASTTLGRSCELGSAQWGRAAFYGVLVS